MPRPWTALLAVAALMCAALPAAQPDRADIILEQARDAIGGAARLDAVHALSFDGIYVREGTTLMSLPSFVQGLGLERERCTAQMHVLLPDKFALIALHLNTIFEEHHGVSGPDLIDEAGIPGNWHPTSLRVPEMFKEEIVRQQRSLARWMLACLLTPPPQFAARVTSVPNVPAAGADVVEVTGACDLRVRLFFDRQTHRLDRLSYHEPPLESRSATPPPKPAAKAPSRSLFTSLQPPAEPTEWVLQMSEYRAHDGILFPHRIRTQVAGKPFETWSISRFRVNARTDLRKFQPNIKYPIPDVKK